MSDPITDALRAAHRAGGIAEAEECASLMIPRAIAAFLRALPRVVIINGGGLITAPDTLAAEVDRVTRRTRA
ncbi:hypothetical protein [Paracraurococcus ruber]|uniref:Uncharacterized protein n=1 Tax=Paracraurococcus ruber TaxID=77675 RepID=A0ABS1CR22_9PROT|nr:hypothetical protein [Paracraurococcus ruber]MBK1656873.1 hypothetical protein [Paracraurococcus ruber]TDG33987.1 hypothetical protein E2C05_01730 [Paracraurococcus ruber]